MRPVTRLLAPLLDAPTNTHICHTCRAQFIPVSTSIARRHASTSWTEKLRSKLWRGEPGGQKDPYGDEGSIERLIRQRQQGDTEVGKREAGETLADESGEKAERYSPKEVSEAANTEDVQEGKISAMLGDEKGYEPAKTWDGLQHVGKTEKIWEDHPKPRDTYRPFMAIERMTAHEDFVSVLQQVTEQMLAEQNSEGQAEPQAVDHLKIPFKDEESQFTYLKRVSQMTGYRFPDSQLSRLSSPTRVLKYLDKASKPRPSKLADVLLANEQLTSLPNVKISGQKVSPMSKEAEVGRWKIIEEELLARGLPVMGQHTK